VQSPTAAAAADVVVVVVVILLSLSFSLSLSVATNFFTTVIGADIAIVNTSAAAPSSKPSAL
jgi:hypothetical protein